MEETLVLLVVDVVVGRGGLLLKLGVGGRW